MAVSKETKTLFSSGPIKFSDLRTNFARQSGGSVKASDLYRETGVGVTNPIVPDADVNENIPAVDSGSSLNLSNFRGTIKEIIIKQSSTDKNLYADSVDGWGSNLSRNIRKVLKITGTVGSDEPSSPSLVWNGDSNNVEIEVAGTIDGSFGAGGTLDNTNGEDGGKAVELAANHKIRFVVKPNAKIRGGGGGGAAGKSGNAGEDGADGVDGSDGFSGPPGASGPGGVPGGDGGDGGLGGFASTRGVGGTGFIDGTGTAGRGGKAGDGGDGGDGGAGGAGGAPGSNGATGGTGTTGDGGRCKGIVDEKFIFGSCGVRGLPDCPNDWQRGPDGPYKSCTWGDSERFRYCYKWDTVQLTGGAGGAGGAGGIGGAGGAGGKGGAGGRGGKGGTGGRGGSGGRGGVGGFGKGYLRTTNTAQLGVAGGPSQDGAAGQAGSPGGNGSAGLQGQYGTPGQQGTSGERVDRCPKGWELVNSASGGGTGGTGQAGATGQAGFPGQAGEIGEAGQAGENGQAGNPGIPGGNGGDYGQDGQNTPFGTAGRGAAAIDGQSGQYHVVIEPANASFSAGVVLGAYQGGTTDTTSAPRTSFVKPQVPAATMTSASSILNEGGTMTFNVTTQNVSNGESLFYTLSGFAVKETDFQYNPDTDSTLFGAFIVNSNAGTFNVVSVTDGLVEDDIEVLVAVRRDSAQGEILAHKYITLTANAT